MSGGKIFFAISFLASIFANFCPRVCPQEISEPLRAEAAVGASVPPLIHSITNAEDCRAVTHPRTNCARCRLTSVIRHLHRVSAGYGRCQLISRYAKSSTNFSLVRSCMLIQISFLNLQHRFMNIPLILSSQNFFSLISLTRACIIPQRP